jgi:hypothetical protein
MEPCSSDHMVALTLGALAHERDGPAIGRPCRLVVRLGSGGKTIDATRRYVEPPEPGMARTLAGKGQRLPIRRESRVAVLGRVPDRVSNGVCDTTAAGMSQSWPSMSKAIWL